MTNITAEHRAAFEALVSGEYDNFALFSCFVANEPAVAIVAINRDGEESDENVPCGKPHVDGSVSHPSNGQDEPPNHNHGEKVVRSGDMGDTLAQRHG